MSSALDTRRNADEEVAVALRDVEDQLAALIDRVRNNVKLAASRVHPELTPFGYKLLWQLRRNGPLNPGALAGVLGVDRSVISRQIRQLEDLGLVSVRTDSADGRAKVLELKPHVADILAGAAADGRSVLHSNLIEWPVDDLREFARLLGNLNSVAH